MNIKFQEVGQQYFSNRTEANFNRFYKVLEPYVRTISRKILKDEELVKENVSDVFVKIYKNDKFEFREDLSFNSWIYNTAKHSAIMLFNKKRDRLEIAESEFHREGEEEMENTLDFLYNSNEVAMREMGAAETEIDEKKSFHDSKSDICKRASQIIDTITSTEQESAILKDVLFNGIGPLEVKECYGLGSRITVTSRRRRGLKKIKEILTPEINNSKFLNKELTNWDVNRLISEEARISEEIGQEKDKKNIALLTAKLTDIRKSIELAETAIAYHENGTVKLSYRVRNGKLDGVVKRFSDTGKLSSETTYTRGIKEGNYKEYYDNGKVYLDGYFTNKKASGLWTRFYENGIISEIHNKDTEDFVLYNEDGSLDQHGNTRVKVEKIETHYPCGSIKMIGFKSNGKRFGIWKTFYQDGVIQELADYFSKKVTYYSEIGDEELAEPIIH